MLNFETDAERYARQEQEIRTRWFGRHELTVQRIAEEHTLLKWKRPASGTYCVRYLLYGHSVIVEGDVGHAIYVMGGPVHVAGWQDVNLHYFSTKCVASEGGRFYGDWDAHKAEHGIRLLVAEWYDELSPADRRTRSGRGDATFLKLTAGQQLAVLDQVAGHFFALDDWSDVRGGCDNERDLHDLLTGAACKHGPITFETETWPSGKVISMRCLAHLVGLKMIEEASVAGRSSGGTEAIRSG